MLPSTDRQLREFNTERTHSMSSNKDHENFQQIDLSSELDLQRSSIMYREEMRDFSQVHNQEILHSPQSTSDSSSHFKDQHDLMAMLTSDGNLASTSSAMSPILLDVHKGRPLRLQVRVMVPVHDHPNFNFVGKLLGPKGNSLKWLQEQTQTKMAILGRGSMRDKQKEEDLRKLGDPKYYHLNEDLHVEITAFAPAPDAYTRIGHALHEVKRFLVPDYYDDIRQQQLRELGILNIDKRNGSKLRINDGTVPHPMMRDIDHAAIHQISSNGTSKVPPPHLVSPHSNGYSDNHSTYCNGENDADLSHYCTWEQKKASFKLSSNLSKGSLYREKPYARIYDDIYH